MMMIDDVTDDALGTDACRGLYKGSDGSKRTLAPNVVSALG